MKFLSTYFLTQIFIRAIPIETNEMACPLRYILIFISMIIALIGISSSLNQQDDDCLCDHLKTNTNMKSKRVSVLETLQTFLYQLFSGEFFVNIGTGALTVFMVNAAHVSDSTNKVTTSKSL